MAEHHHYSLQGRLDPDFRPDQAAALFEPLDPETWAQRLSQARERAPQAPSEADLGILVHNSTPPGGELFRGRNGFLKSKELRNQLRIHQTGSQARKCGSAIGAPAVLGLFPGKLDTMVYGVAGGESTCKSPRCPVCRNPLMSRRQQQIQFCIDKWVELDPSNRVTMLTLTAPHTRADLLSDFLGSTKDRVGMRGAVALLKQRKLWRRHVRHYVCGLEITHGKNGYHAHFHVLIFHAGNMQDSHWLSAWQSACETAGLGLPSAEHGVHLQEAHRAAEYMAKWSVAAEGAGGHHKEARQGNRSIWQIEQDAAAGCLRSRKILFVYNNRTFRARWHNFSRSLRPWLKEWKASRPDAVPLLVMDKSSTLRLNADDQLKKLLVELASEELANLAELPAALDLGGEVPTHPELVWVNTAWKRELISYNRAVEEGRDLDASYHWASYQWHVEESIRSSAYVAGRAGEFVRPQNLNNRVFDPGVFDQYADMDLATAWSIFENTNG